MEGDPCPFSFGDKATPCGELVRINNSYKKHLLLHMDPASRDLAWKQIVQSQGQRRSARLEHKRAGAGSLETDRKEKEQEGRTEKDILGTNSDEEEREVHRIPKRERQFVTSWDMREDSPVQETEKRQLQFDDSDSDFEMTEYYFRKTEIPSTSSRQSERIRALAEENTVSANEKSSPQKSVAKRRYQKKKTSRNGIMSERDETSEDEMREDVDDDYDTPMMIPGAGYEDSVAEKNDANSTGSVMGMINMHDVMKHLDWRQVDIAWRTSWNMKEYNAVENMQLLDRLTGISGFQHKLAPCSYFSKFFYDTHQFEKNQLLHNIAKCCWYDTKNFTWTLKLERSVVLEELPTHQVEDVLNVWPLFRVRGSPNYPDVGSETSEPNPYAGWTEEFEEFRSEEAEIRAIMNDESWKLYVESEQASSD